MKRSLEAKLHRLNLTCKTLIEVATLDFGHPRRTHS